MTYVVNAFSEFAWKKSRTEGTYTSSIQNGSPYTAEKKVKTQAQAICKYIRAGVSAKFVQACSIQLPRNLDDLINNLYCM